MRNPPKSKSSPSGLLHFATDWKILFNLGTATYVFPSFLSNTLDRPDICLFSVKSHCVILIELMCPREENMEDWNRIKSERYATLCDSIKNCGWIVSSFTIGVGARGYCAKNIVPTLLHLGFTSKAAHATCNEVSWISMQASFCICLASNSHEWVQPPLIGTHENPVENQRIKSTELNACDQTATVTLLPSKSVPSLVPSSQSLDLCTRITRTAKISHFENLCKNPSSNEFWKTVKPFITDKGHYTSEDYMLEENDDLIKDNKKICDLFHDFFVNIIERSTGKKTATTSKDKFLEDIISTYKDHPSIKSIKEHIRGIGFSMLAADEENIYKILVSLNPKKRQEIT